MITDLMAVSLRINDPPQPPPGGLWGRAEAAWQVGGEYPATPLSLWGKASLMHRPLQERTKYSSACRCAQQRTHSSRVGRCVAEQAA